MGQSAGFDGEHFSADADRSALVSQVVALVSEWDGLLTQNPQPGDPRLWQLGERSSALDPSSRAAGFGGVGHHLSELKRLVEIGADAGQFRAQLEVVREMAQHAAASLGAAPAPRPAPPPDDPTLAPPPLLTMFRPKSGAMLEAPASPAQAPAPPPPARAPAFDPAPTPYVSASPLAQSGPQAASGGAFGVAPPPLVGFGPAPSAAPVLPAPEAPPQLHHPVAGAPPTPRLPDPADPLRPDAPSALGSSSVREVGGGFAAAPKPAPFRPEGGGAPGQAPNLLVRSMLGLRAFGKTPKEPVAAAPGASASRPSLLNLKRGSSPKGHLTPQHLSRQVPQVPPLANAMQPREVSRQMSAHHADPAPPPLVNENRSGLPPLPPGVHATPIPGRGSSPNDLRGFVDRVEHARDVKQRGRRGRNRLPQRSGMDFRLWLLAGAGFFGLVIVIVAVAIKGGRTDDRDTGPAGSSSAGPSASGSAEALGALPRSRLLNDDEQFRSLLQQVHGKGKDTPELRALLEEQASVASRVLATESCTGSAVECAAIREMKEVVTGKPSRLVRRKRSGNAWKSKWLAGLKMPDIPVEDDPRVQRRFEFYTENPVGRETFQQMLFRCGAHKDLIQTALIRRNLSPDLLAVVFAESGCSATAKSPAGAEGLWQFIPDAARAYHLRIIEGVVDERHSPAKSTEAAVKYFSDLKQRLGDWDLCFAAYNMGPFGLMARIERTGEENVTFWDLVDSDLIPDETEGYAPGIQAIALILANLQKLKFSAIQMRAPQITADLDVPPQTRLSMIARAAATSVSELKRLNLDLKSDRTPNLPSFAVQVPKDVVWQARDTLQELVRSKDEADLCVPQSFDWGRQRFTAEMAKACERSLSSGAAIRGAEPAPDLGGADLAPEAADPGAAPAPPRPAPRPRPAPGMPDTPD